MQRLDQKRFAEACEAGFVHLTKGKNAYEAVQTAFYRARTESRPILLSAPMNVQQQSFDDEEEYVPSAQLLATAEPPYPNPRSLAAAADILAGSERPVIIAGRERLAVALEDVQHYDLEPGTLDPRDICRILDEKIPPEIGLIIGGGQNICFTTTPDLGGVGRALGGRGALVTTLDELGAAVDEYVANPVPTIIDARISPTVISIPYRRLHFGQDA